MKILNSTFKTLSTVCYRIGTAVLYPFIKVCQPLRRKFRPLRHRLGRKKRRLLVISLIAIGILVPLIYFVAKPKAVAAWWDEMWRYRKSVPISSTNSSTQTDYQVLIDGLDTSTLVTDGKMQSDCGDIRFISNAGVILDYSIVGNTCNTSDTEIWVKVDSIPNSGTTIYFYYGNPSAPSYQNESETFGYSSEKTVAYVLSDKFVTLDLISLENSNSVTHNSITRTLDVGGTSTITASNYGSVTAKKLFQMDDTVDGTDIVIPVSWAGTEFIYRTRTTANSDEWFAVSPWGSATVRLYAAGVEQVGCGSPWTVTSSGSAIACDIAVDTTFRVTSSIPILVSFEQNPSDAYPLYPATTDYLYGYTTTDYHVAAGPNGADYRYIDSDDASETNPADLGANASNKIDDGGNWFNLKPRRTYSNTGNGPIGTQQVANGDGGDATTHVSRKEFGTRFGSALQADSIGIVSDQPAKCTAYNGTTSSIETETLTSSNTTPVIYGHPNVDDFGTGNSSTYTTAAWTLTCDKPVYAFYQASSDDGERNLWSYPMMRQFTYPTPSVGALGSEEKGTGPIAYWSFDEGYGTTVHNQMEKNGEDGLVSWWKMDEGADNTCLNGTDDVCDTMAINDAVRSGATWTTSGKIGKTLDFDSTDDYVNAGSDGSIDNLTTFTIMAWIYPHTEGEDTGGMIVGQSTGGLSKKFLRIKSSEINALNGFVDTNSEDPRSISADNTLTMNQWQHVAMTYDDSGDRIVRIYHNGSEVSYATQVTGTGTITDTNAMNLVIGNDETDLANTFDGLIDQTKVFNRSLSASEIEAEYKSNHGHMIDMAPSSDWVDGAQQNPNQKPMGKALDFDGSNDIVRLPATTDLAEDSPWTISYWFWQNAGTNDDTTLGDGTDDYNLFEHDTNGTRLQVIPNGATSVDLTFPYDTRGSWHHAMVTCDGSATATFKLYLDGKEVDSKTNATSQFRLNTFGQAETAVGTYFWAGKLDEIKVWDYKLTAEQAKIQYNRGFGQVMGADDQANKGAGPKGFWKFDEGSAYTAFDSSGNENHGELTNMDPLSDWLAGKIGKALDFDGTNDYVDIDTIVSDLGSDTTGTWTAWINMDDYSNGEHIIAFGDTNASEFIRLRNNAGKLYAHVKDAGTNQWALETDNVVFTSNNWYHVAIVQDGTSPVLYVNGISPPQTFTVSTDKASWFFELSGIDNGRIGRMSQNSGEFTAYFTGKIDHVKIYDYARTAGQIHQDMTIGSPIGHWNFDEGHNTTVHNQQEENGEHELVSWWKFDDASSGQSPAPQDEMGVNDGTWVANAAYTSTAKIGNAATFDGTGDYVTVTDNATVSVTGPLTVSLWARFTSAGTVETTLGKWSTPNFSYILWKNASNQANFSISGNGTTVVTVTGTTGLSINTWYHLAGVYDGTSIKIYVDGGLENTNSTSIPASIHDGSTDLLIGRNQGDATQDWPGQLDQVKVFKRALSAADVQEEYDSIHGHMMYMDASSDWVDGARSNSNQKPMGKALEFDASNDYVTVGDKDELDGLSTITVSTWVNFSSLSIRQSLISKAYDFCSQVNYSVSSYSLAFNSDNDKIYWDVFTCNIAGCREVLTTNKTDWQTGRWYHIVGTWEEGSPGVQKIYVDGVLDNSSAPDGIGMNATTTPLVFGMNSKELTFHLNGKLDETKIYNYALTNNEVKVQYNRGKAMVLGAGASESDPNSSSVGWWKMDEASGYAAFDNSGNGNDGKLTNMDSSDWVSGKIGKALDFDGSNDYVTMGDVLDFERTDSFSIGAWIKIDNHSTFRMIVDKKDADSPYRGYRFYVDQNDGSLRFDLIHDDGTSEKISVDSGTDVTDDAWHYVVVTYDGSSAASGVDFYLDGVLDSGTTNTDNLSDTTVGPADFHIGATENGGYPFDGLIDNVKIFNTDLTAGQVAWEYNQGKPMAHWRFDEKDGSTAYDESNHDYDGTLTSMDPANDWVTGKRNGALDFDSGGTADYVAFSSSVENTPPFTVCAWVNPDSIAADKYIISNGGQTTASYGFALHLNSSSDWSFITRSSGGTGGGTTVDASSTNWTHLCGSWDGTTDADSIKLYINGVLGNSATAGSVSSGTAQNLRIGAPSNGTTYSWDGQIDEAKVYNYALTADQIKVDYNNGAVTFR